MKINRKIVLIMCDSQRWDMVNCYKDTGLKTPCIDKLASEGVRFNRAYTTQPVCQPARAGIFTGMLPHSSQSSTNSVGMADNVQTIGKRLEDLSVHTAYIGKWHLDGGDYFGKGICPQGWDGKYWYDMKNYLDELSDQDKVRSREPRIMDKDGVDAEFTFAHRCTNRAIDFLENYHEDDFFLVVSYDEPHQPHLCPEPFASMYKDYAFPKYPDFYDTLENKPEHQKIWAQANYIEDHDSYELKWHHYFGCNSYVDYEVGRVVEAVDKYAEDALIIYTSDHGDFLSSRSLSGKGPATYDEITRIPLIMRMKGQIEQGIVDENPVSHIDLAPTIFDVMQLEKPSLFEGNSLVKELQDPTFKTNDCIYMEFGRYELLHDGFGGFQPLRCCFDGRFKLTINLLSSDELYDLQNDPHEMNNIINKLEYEKIRNDLHDKLLDKMNETLDPLRGYYWECRPWRTDRQDVKTWSYTQMVRNRFNDLYEPRPRDYSTGLPLETQSKQNESLKDK